MLGLFSKKSAAASGTQPVTAVDTSFSAGSSVEVKKPTIYVWFPQKPGEAGHVSLQLPKTFNEDVEAKDGGIIPNCGDYLSFWPKTPVAGLKSGLIDAYKSCCTTSLTDDISNEKRPPDRTYVKDNVSTQQIRDMSRATKQIVRDTLDDETRWSARGDVLRSEGKETHSCVTAVLKAAEGADISLRKIGTDRVFGLTLPRDTGVATPIGIAKKLDNTPGFRRVP